jgi:cytochrome c peroxidase
MNRMLTLALTGALSLAGSLAQAADKAPADNDLRAAAKAQLGVLPKKMVEPAFNKATPEKVELGKALYFEPRLSLSQSISCNSCHNLAAGGSDNLPKSIGHEAARGGRNAPTVLNAGFQFVQFWDGRAPSLEAQAVGPITNPVEMAMPGENAGAQVIKVLRSIPAYETAFTKAFGKDGEPVTMKRVGMAIAAFERTLVSRGKFDRYLEGDNKALSAQEKRGLQTFLDVGCAGCHNGPAVGGQMYQKVGMVKPWPDQHDQGRYEVTKDEADRMLFKVPLLRNIARTAPYFHEGDVWSLDEAIKKMATHQLGRELEAAQVADIKAFLQALDGDPLTVTLPKLPASSDQTPPPAMPASISK